MGLRYSWKRILIVIKLLIWRGGNGEISQVVLRATFGLELKIFVCLGRGGGGGGGGWVRGVGETWNFSSPFKYLSVLLEVLSFKEKLGNIRFFAKSPGE